MKAGGKKKLGQLGKDYNCLVCKIDLKTAMKFRRHLIRAKHKNNIKKYNKRKVAAIEKARLMAALPSNKRMTRNPFLDESSSSRDSESESEATKKQMRADKEEEKK